MAAPKFINHIKNTKQTQAQIGTYKVNNTWL